MILMSKALPGMRIFEIQPYFNIYEFFPNIEDTTATMSIDQMDSIREVVNYRGWTIGPSAPPINFITTTWCDTLAYYTTQSRTLGWITTQTIANKYLNYFSTAKTQLQSNNFSGAKTTLLQVLTDVNVDSSSTLTSEAYALLRFNVEYLIGHIPPNKPEGVQGLFKNSQATTVTWNGEYSPTMLPNGGGYNLYRAVYYDGSSLSYTKLNASLLTTTSYTDNPVIATTIPAGKNVYLKYYLIAQNNLNVTSVPSDTVSLFVGKTVSGPITVNTTWSENKIIVGDVTVSSGKTLIISAGKIIRFANNQNLISNGVLTAIGSTTLPITFTSLNDTVPGSWGSIVMEGDAGTLSKIDYGIVQYGTEVFGVNMPWIGIFISNCTIKNMINGVRINSSNAWVIDSKIIEPRDHGIIAENEATVASYHNIINKTGFSGAGILYAGGAYDYVWGNKISGFSWGIGAIAGSSPTFGHPSNGGENNLLTNCEYGLMFYSESYPAVGYPSDWDDGMTYGNNVFNNGINVDLNNSPDDYIYANNVYWGLTDLDSIGN
ncbi:MAG TPA: hypothetical protein DCQ28_01795, partial [Bacteroidetes bacterium]|nr:hypothetical protein [Bacteroidota bacterium]